MAVKQHQNDARRQTLFISYGLRVSPCIRGMERPIVPPAMRRRHPETIKSVLQRVVRTLDVEDRLASHSVGPVWDRVVPERLAAHTRPSSLRGGVLLIEARSAVWMNEASLLREKIRAAINAEIGRDKVRQVRFQLGGGFPPSPATGFRSPEIPVEAIEEAHQELGGNEGARLAARARALQKSRRPYRS